jgi:predicted lipoprotein with Yx(FWY)xxD motif
VGRRTIARVAALAAVGALGVGAALAVTTPILKVSHNGSLGSIIVNGKGLTLYHVSSEHGAKLTCTGNCVYFWFPVIVTAKTKIVVGAGLSKSKIGTVKRPNGALQLTYNKLPLYRYYLDRKAGQVKGQGVKDPAGTWYAVSSGGKVVTKRPATSTSSTTTTIGIGY